MGAQIEGDCEMIAEESGKWMNRSV
jgi:hypothetical protein